MSITPQEAEAILSPYLDKYIEATESENWDVVQVLYHPNGVLVHKNHEATYGNEAITEELKKFAANAGKVVSVLSNKQFEGVGEFLIVRADFSSETEKTGKVTGKFLQIWKKKDNSHRIYHDEFQLDN
ncbi:unnamed protein product [Caenorhabditis sp. 36 PRJEB53466]|nr:unnamed protein product [Caenorhabditis sp. 36 PRJEB53466]